MTRRSPFLPPLGQRNCCNSPTGEGRLGPERDLGRRGSVTGFSVESAEELIQFLGVLGKSPEVGNAPFAVAWQR